ncbi:MAG: UDP-N-acetylmuramate--L-alanine ligase [Pseudomonadota bacterium]
MAAPDTYHVPEMGRIRTIHFVGIGGAGMCGIAEVLLNQGYAVSGSDVQASENVDRLRKLGAQIRLGHDGGLGVEVDVVVTSSAIAVDNPEVVAAQERRIPIIPRAEMLGELMRYRHGIAVAGTHGKTTTTSLVTEIFRCADLSPTFVIGGLLKSAGKNAELGAGRYLIAEADESDASFLFLQPMSAVITNIDRDHMATYGNDFARLKDTFVDFVHRLPFYGSVVVCLDDPEVVQIIPQLTRRILTYGLSADAQFRAVDITQVDGHTRFVVQRGDLGADLVVTLAIPGMHNVLNALAAIAIATDEGIADADIVAGLSDFAGVDRRFQVDEQVVAADHTITLVDDYGHHPTEVAAVIETARTTWPEQRLVMVYQPHRYTRTRDLFDDFSRVLATVDILVVLEVYAAGEDAIAGADGRALCQSIRERTGSHPLFVEDTAEALTLLPTICQDGDVLLVQGAGNVSAVSRSLREVAHA